MKLFVAFLFCASTSLVEGFALDFPRPTPAGQGIELEPQGWSPAPTKAPSIFELRRRQQVVPGLIVATDGTCGYTSASSGKPFGLCCSTCSCGFATTPGHYGGLYCCNTASCQMRIPTTCIDGPAFSTGTICNSACASDTNTIKCTASPYIYCNLVEFQGVVVQALYCDSTKVSSTQSLYTTYSGQVGHVFSPFAGFSSSSTSSSSQSTSSTATTTSSSSATDSTTATSTTTSSRTTTAPPTDTSAPSPAPIGAIVGGAVGGVALLAIAGLVVFFCLRRRSRASHVVQTPPAPIRYDTAPAIPQAQSPYAAEEKPFYSPAPTAAYPSSTAPQYSQQAPGYQYDQALQVTPVQPQEAYSQPVPSQQYGQPNQYGQPTPYDPSRTTSPYSYGGTVDPRAVEAQNPNRYTVSTVRSDVSSYAPTAPGELMAQGQIPELGSSGPVQGRGGVAGRHEVQG